MPLAKPIKYRCSDVTSIPIHAMRLLQKLYTDV